MKQIQFLLMLTMIFQTSSVLASGFGNGILTESDRPCNARVNQLVAGKYGKDLKVTVQTYRSSGNMLSHYRSELYPDYKVHIDRVHEYKTKMGEVTGYRYEISDGGDESNVYYYVDAKGKVVYARWHNQSPVSFWFCEK